MLMNTELSGLLIINLSVSQCPYCLEAWEDTSLALIVVRGKLHWQRGVHSADGTFIPSNHHNERGRQRLPKKKVVTR